MTQTLNPAQADRIRPFLPPRLLKGTSALPYTPSQTNEIALALNALRQGISAYLPRYLVEALHEDPVPGRAGCEFKSGTVMFADVSGFTAMSEKLSALGKEGAEEMTGIVNAYFEAMLDISEAMGGDLLKFGGDALMIFFEGGHGAAGALATAWSMQAGMSQFAAVETSQGVFPLQMSIGMASGPLILLKLGSAEEMYYTVMGRTLGRMAQMEEKATAGQIVLDKETAEIVAGQVKVKQVSEVAFLLEEADLVIDPPRSSESSKVLESTSIVSLSSEIALVEAISSYIPQELLVRLIADPDHPVRRGSHRPVTNMFANFIGLDEIVEGLGSEGQEAILAIADAYFGPMSQILNRYGGTISRLDNYSQGQRILALFGALQAHEDDPERAVRAGIEMNRTLTSVNQTIRSILSETSLEATELSQRIGINTGFVFAGSVGSPRRREYTVMGAQVNLTARLMSIARVGDVLIGGSTSRHIESAYALSEQEPVKVKGISEPVRNFVVGKERSKQARLTRLASTPIHGREAELGQSRQVMGEVLDGHGRTLVISGDSGIGKSRLIEEIVSEAMAGGLEVVDGACLSYGRTMTYHPWAEILRALFGFTTEQSPEERIRILNRHMEQIEQGLFTPLIGQVMGLPVEDNDLTRDLDAKLRRQRVLDLMLQLLQARAAGRPLLVLIEDAHWADDASRDLINYVGRNIGEDSLFLLLSHRPDEGLPAWHELPGGLGLALGGLTAGACLALARQILGDQPLAQRLETFVLEKGGGNPLFLGEVIRNLIDAATIVQDEDGVWDLPEGAAAVELPDTIHGMIISRMDRLEPADRRMLQVAAVVGRSFSTPTLDGVYEFDMARADITQRIRIMAEKGLVELMDGGEALFRFTHLTTQEVVYESLSYELRRDLHCRIGTHYEDKHADSLNEWIDLLAYHYYEGQAWPKAATYNLQAGQRAQREYANQAAIAACTKVLDAVEKLDEVDKAMVALPAYETLGEVHTLIGEYDLALDQLSRAKGILDHQEEGEEQIRRMADLLRKTADVYERQGAYDEAFQWLERAVESLGELPPGLEIPRIQLMRAGIYHRQGANDQAVDWCIRSSEAAAAIDNRESLRVMGQAHYLQGAALYRQAKYREALRACQKSLQLYEEVGDVLGQARAYNNLANVYSDLGEWENSTRAYEQSLAMNQKIGNIQEQGFVQNNLGNIYLDRGEWEKAVGLFRESNAIWKKIGAPLPDAVTLSNLSQAYLNSQDWEEVLEILAESDRIFKSLGSEDFVAELERRWAEYYLGVDQMAEAMSHIESSLTLAIKQEARYEEGISLRIKGEIESALGNPDQAEQAFLSSLAILEELDAEYQAAKTKLALAKFEWRLHKAISKYASRLDEAIEAFQHLSAGADLREARSLGA